MNKIKILKEKLNIASIPLDLYFINCNQIPEILVTTLLKDRPDLFVLVDLGEEYELNFGKDQLDYLENINKK